MDQGPGRAGKDADHRRENILTYLKEKGPVTPKQISRDLDIPYGTLSMDTRILRDRGLVKWHLGIKGILELAPEKEEKA